MPILQIEHVGRFEHDDRRSLAQRIADAAGRVFESGSGETWVRFRTLEDSDYAENGGGARNVKPVFVSVLRRSHPPADALAIECRALSQAIAEVCHRPVEHVHITYELPGEGRQAFGGKLLPPSA